MAITFDELGLPDNLFYCCRYDYFEDSQSWFELWDKETETKKTVNIADIIRPLLGDYEPTEGYVLIDELIKKVKGKEEADRDYRFRTWVFSKPELRRLGYPESMHPSNTNIGRELRRK